MDRAQQVEALFHAAIQREPAQRQAFLAGQCKDDPALLTDVESLLSALEGAPDFLEEPLCGTLPQALTKEAGVRFEDESESLIGQRIGAWELSRKIAEGGMGAVYLARRADGHYQKEVAIKLIRRGIVAENTAQRNKVIRRFRDELQHHAILDHPNIAKLLDGGTTADGLPYLVVEYVEGQPIYQYCTTQALSTKQRLKLFQAVCLAVQHAHNRFIAHCDIKPSNILVAPSLEPGGEPAPKLLDFGIARFLRHEDDGRLQADLTTGMFPMTPQYASPEQVQGEPLTAASDVYSLGVVLYELICGRRPYDVTEYDAKTIICERIPKRPSAVQPSVDREVDTIVLKALEKDPARRYASAAALAEDIDRYLTGRPILAHKDSALYRFSKFFARHRSRIATGGLVAAAVMFGIWIGSLSRQSERQVAEAEWSNRISRLDSVGRRLYTEAVLLDAGAQRLEAEKKYSDARVCFRQVINMEQDLPPGFPSRSEWLSTETKRLLGHCLLQLRQYEEAEPLLLESYPFICRHWGDDHRRARETRQWIAAMYEARGQPAKARKYRTKRANK